MEQPPTAETPSKLCGASTRSGGTCGKPAGWGTDYSTGRCSLHGGATPNHQRKAQREIAREAMTRYGQPAEDVDPFIALWGELRRTAGHVAWLGALLEAGELTAEQNATGKRRVVALAQNTLAGDVPSVWMELYQRERKHLLDVSKTAIAAGLEERRVRLEEAQGEWVASAIRQVLSELGHDLGDERVQQVVRGALTAGGVA